MRSILRGEASEGFQKKNAKEKTTGLEFYIPALSSKERPLQNPAHDASFPKKIRSSRLRFLSEVIRKDVEFDHEH